MSHYSVARIREGIGHFVIGRGIAAVMALVVNIILVRILEEREYAAYVTLVALQLFLLTLSSHGIDRVVARYIPAAVVKDAWSGLSIFLLKLVSVKTASVTIILVISTLLATWLTITLNLPDFAHLLPAFWAYTLGFALFETLVSAAQALMLQHYVKVQLVLQWGLRLVTLFVLTEFDVAITLNVVLWIFAATSLLTTLGLAMSVFWYMRARVRDVKAHPPVVWPQDMKPITQMGIHNYLQGLAWLPSSGASLRLLAASFLSVAVTGAFGFFQTLTGTLQRYMPIMLILGLIESIVAGRYEQERDIGQMNSTLSAALKVNLLILAPLIAWLVVAGQDVVILLTGGKFADLAGYLPVMVAVLIPGGHWQVFSVAANSVEKSHILPRATLVANVALVPVVLVLTMQPLYGMAAMAFGAIVIEVVRNMLGIAMIRHDGIEYRLDRNGMAKITLAAILAGFAGYVVHGWLEFKGSFLAATASLVTLLVVFLLIMVWKKAFTASERRMLAKLVGNRAIPI
jgi:O-antigen/teichoic acid export membrane protein